ncbi:MAG: hydantoinase/oxoprolinase family protein, partial [Desulfobacterales bacterium]|nr:hydantoinase/oxoprolinase family protein [Desulfobacterales bacterium]
DRGIDPGLISRAVLSTTLTTNAIVQDKLAPVGMIVASGPGVDPEFFRIGENYHPVCGSIDHRGREVDPLDGAEIIKIAKRFKKKGIQYVGVACKFSVRNPNHELQISEILRPYVDKVFMGHQCSGNLNFPRRIATSYLNASVYPIHKKFFEAVKKSLEKKGLTIPIHILKADGGTMSFEASIDFPAQTIQSGPAASVMGAIAFAPVEEESIVLDIGGTTTDMAVLINRVPVLEPLGINLGGYKTLLRSLKTLSIGVGGDSHVRVDNGTLKIGPERVGPAMAHGGPAPTPTDALIVLGLLKRGDPAKAARGFETLAGHLGVSVAVAAQQVFDETCRKILAAVQDMLDRLNSQPVYTIHELYEGRAIKPEIMLVIGGPAPYFAKRLEALSSYRVGVVPRWKVANAIGAALARTTCEVTLFADTEQGIVAAPEENYHETADRDFSQEDALEAAFMLLRQKALRAGSNADDLVMEVVENLKFNMVRGFYTSGRNIRIKVQVKPGLINEYDTVAGLLATED